MDNIQRFFLVYYVQILYLKYNKLNILITLNIHTHHLVKKIKIEVIKK